MQYARELRIYDAKNPFSQNFIKFDLQEMRIIIRIMKSFNRSRAHKGASCVSKAGMDFLKTFEKMNLFVMEFENYSETLMENI